MNPIEQFAHNDTFATAIGIELIEASAGCAKARLHINETHLNGLKTVHGGVIFTLADFVFAVASNGYGTIAMAINVHISYIKAATEGILFAEATEVSKNPKLAVYAVNVTNTEGELVAAFQGMAYRKKETIPM